MQGAPSTLSYDLDAGYFELAQTSDIEARGQYNVQLIASVDVSDGLDPPTITTVQGEIAFTVFIEPCPVTDYSVTPASIEPIIYVLGDPTFTFGEYFFTETEACGYD